MLNTQDFFHCLETKYSELDSDKLEELLIVGNYSDDEDRGGGHRNGGRVNLKHWGGTEDWVSKCNRLEKRTIKKSTGRKGY